MIRLSRLADYAVLLMSHMTRQPKEVHAAVVLADKTRLPMPTVSKILAKMARAGLLESVRGRGGGYRLAFSPRDITVEQIISAVDGPIALTICLESHGVSCKLEDVCPSQPNWRRINDALRHALSGVSLSEISNPVPLNFALPARTQVSASDFPD